MATDDGATATSAGPTATTAAAAANPETDDPTAANPDTPTRTQLALEKTKKALIFFFVSSRWARFSLLFFLAAYATFVSIAAIVMDGIIQDLASVAAACNGTFSGADAALEWMDSLLISTFAALAFCFASCISCLVYSYLKEKRDFKKKYVRREQGCQR